MTNATQREESAERLARPLIQLAKASGLSTSFFDQLGTYTEISDEALVAVLAALGIDASSDEAIAHSLELHDRHQRAQLIPPTIVATVGKTTTVEINCNADCDITASITLEDGGTFEEDLDALPDLDSAHRFPALCRWAITPCMSPPMNAPPKPPSSTPPRISKCRQPSPSTIVGAG